MNRCLALVATVLTLGLSSVAIAQPTLSAPVELSTAGVDAANISIALSTDGTSATAVWREASPNGNYRVKTSSGTISGGVATWGPISTLSAADINVLLASVKTSSDGSKAVAMWVGKDSSKGTVLQSSAATITGNIASWGGMTPINITSDAIQPILVLSADGSRAFALWVRSQVGNSCGAATASLGSISGTTVSWGKAKRVSERGSCIEDANLGISASGGAVTVVWSAASANRTRIVKSRTGTVSGTTVSWGSVTDLSAPDFHSKNSAIAMSSDGTKATAVWARARVDSLRRVVAPIVIRSRSATINGNTATWGATTVLSSTTDGSQRPLLGLSSDGTSATSTWIRHVGKTYQVESSSASIVGNAASWGTPTSISGAGAVVRLHTLSVTPDGSKAVSVWLRIASSKLVVQGASGNISGSNQLWSSLFEVSNPSQFSSDPAGVMSSDGAIALLGWHQNDGSGKYIAQARVAEIIHPTPTPTPLATSTPTLTPTPAPTTTPVGQISTKAPAPSSFSNDHYVVLRVRDYPNNFRRSYYGYLLRSSDYKIIRMGKFKVRNNRGRLTFHDVPPGVYRSFTVVTRTKEPRVISSRPRTVVVK